MRLFALATPAIALTAVVIFKESTSGNENIKLDPRNEITAESAERLASWADDPMGPLILKGGNGYPALSLFARETKAISRDATVAFRVCGKNFVTFLNDLERVGSTNKTGATPTKADVVDHAFSWSSYFSDPDQNRLELTTYGYDLVAGLLRAAN